MSSRPVSRRQTPARTAAQKASASVVVSRAHLGPLPDPAVLQRYEEILPGAAERILAMAEANAAHRREAQKQEMEATIAAVNRQIDRHHCKIFKPQKSHPIPDGLYCLIKN